jgi:adenylate kinase
MERIPFVSLVGSEGSGKTTQAKILAERLNLPYICTGDMIRDAAKNDPSELGQACRDMFERHNYLPGPLLLKIVENRLKREDTKNGVVFDGGFRTQEETENLANTL